MKKKLILSALMCYGLVAFAQSNGLTLIKEVPDVYPGNTNLNPTKFYPHDNGILVYYKKMKGMQLWGYEANIANDYAFTDVHSLNISETGTMLSKIPYTDLSDVNNGKLLLTDPNNYKDVYLEVYDLTATKRPEYTVKITKPGFEQLGRVTEKKDYYDANGNRALWDCESSVFTDHAVSPVMVKMKEQKSYISFPTVVEFANPKKCTPVIPDLPRLNTDDSEEKALWDYYTSSATAHYFSIGYQRVDKKAKIDTCVNVVAMVDNAGTVTKTFAIDMKMPGFTVLKYNRFLVKGRNAFFYDKITNSILLTAMAEDKKGDSYLIVKKCSAEGALLWETAAKVDGRMFGAQYPYNGIVLTVNNANNEFVFSDRIKQNMYEDFHLDITTGKHKVILNKKQDLKSDIPWESMSKNIATPIQTFMKANKDIEKLMYVNMLKDGGYVVAFWTKKNAVKIYSLKI